MYGVLSFDELNQLSFTRRSIPYEKYFGDMGLTKRQKEKRIELAESFEEEFVELLSWMFYVLPYTDTETLIAACIERYEKVYAEYYELDDYMRNYIRDWGEYIVESVLQNPDDPYMLSKDRAKFAAENEANSSINYQEYRDAIKRGYTHKKWRTMKDKKVRETHREVDDVETRIDEPFEVGDYLMMFPKDTTFGAGPEEIVNCRCSVKYLRKTGESLFI